LFDLFAGAFNIGASAELGFENAQQQALALGVAHSGAAKKKRFNAKRFS
jgi:hypothetical protein